MNAKERLDRWMRSVLAKSKLKELEKDVVDELVENCRGKPLATTAFSGLNIRGKKVACAALEDRKEELEMDNTMDAIILLYMVATSKRYMGEDTDKLIAELIGLKNYYDEFSRLMGFGDPMVEINRAILPEELEDIPSHLLIAYCELMFISLPERYKEFGQEYDPFTPEELTKLRIYTVEGKYKHMERLRVDLYIHDTIFGAAEYRLSKFLGFTYWYSVPLAADIMENDLSYYYPRMGGLTNTELSNRFNSFELLYMLAQFYQGEVPVRNGLYKEELTSLIITKLYEREEDPRSIVTPFGVRLQVNTPWHIEQLNVSLFAKHTYDVVSQACAKEGIRTIGYKGGNRGIKDLWHDYLVTQLVEDFIFDIEGTKFPEEVSLGVYTSIEAREPHTEPRTDIIWYGGRNGTTMYKCITLSTLILAFDKYSSFVCPFDISTRFSDRSIRRLANMLSEEDRDPSTLILANLLSKLLISRGTVEIKGMLEEQSLLLDTIRTMDEKRVKRKLMLLHNLGRFFSSWTDEGPISLINDDDTTIDDLSGRRFASISGITSVLVSIQDIPEMLELKICLIYTEYNEEGVETIYPMLEHEHDASTIGEYLTILCSAHRFGIDALLQHSSRVLLATSEKYLRELYGVSFMDSYKLEIDAPIPEVVSRKLDYSLDYRPYTYSWSTNTSIPLKGDQPITTDNNTLLKKEWV